MIWALDAPLKKVPLNGLTGLKRFLLKMLTIKFYVLIFSLILFFTLNFMAFWKIDNAPEFSLPRAPRPSLGGVNKVVRVAMLASVLVGQVLSPGILSAEEAEEVGPGISLDVDDVSEAAEPLRKALIQYLAWRKGDILNVIVSDQLSKGQWDETINPLDFKKFSVHKADFLKTEEITYFFRFIEGNYYFSLKPELLFGDASKVRLVSGVLDKEQFLKTAFPSAPTP